MDFNIASSLALLLHRPESHSVYQHALCAM